MVSDLYEKKEKPKISRARQWTHLSAGDEMELIAYQ
jgi:hypothetical protein